MSTLSPLMLTATAGMAQNVALDVSAALTANLAAYNSVPVVAQFNSIVSSASAVLNASVLEDLQTLANASFPALTNAIPSTAISDLAGLAPDGTYPDGFTGLAAAVANGLMGDGDLGMFAQIYNSAVGYAGQANQYINSSENVGVIANTFGAKTGGMDNVITGGFNQVTEAFQPFGNDLEALGRLWNMDDLENLGDPIALVRQLARVGGLTSSVENALRRAGLDTAQIVGIITDNFEGLTDTADKILYRELTTITGNELSQILAVLGVTTDNIENMADLLNPVKILPSSFNTLTMPTPDGLRGIYLDSNGTVNYNLERYLV